MLGLEANDVSDTLRAFGRELLRLFVLDPDEVRPLPRFLQIPLHAIGRWLGIQSQQPLSQWVLRLFLRPPSAGSQRARSVRLELYQWVIDSWALIKRFLGPVFAWLMLPWHLLKKRLDAFDYEKGSKTMGLWAAHANQSPWILRVGLSLIVLLAFVVVVTTPLPMKEQFIFFIALWLISIWLMRFPGRIPALLLITISITATTRYIWWRLTSTLDLNSTADYVLGTGLLLAEAYTWVVIFLGYIQCAWPLNRQSVPLPDDTSKWPTVDVFIPTYDEPFGVVKPTVLGACGIDWPRDKINIYLLDDGNRPELREFAAQAGVHYLTRTNNLHAKAGNLNNALAQTHGEFIAIFDCDHIPVRSFLTVTMGCLVQDPKCALVQTPHHFFSPDPFERNLETFHRVPNEGSLFYGLVQDGNDLWNATFFCGSCAVIRRKPLEEVGGLAVETVTEDAHTSIKIHRLGYTSAYLNNVQAAGLATESLSGHIGQRIRWARGMAQTFRIDNPLLGRGLSLPQRLNYINSMMHFFHGLPRLVFFTAPLSFLYFNLHIISASAVLLALYALPHLVQANIANTRLQGRYRHSFWAEVYESVLAWYITLPTTAALFNPRAGKFNVTVKGGLVNKTYFDWGVSKPYLFLIALNIGGLLLGVLRLFFWNSHEQSTVILNMVWTLHNVIMLGTAISVAVEARQVRAAPRVVMKVQAQLHLPNGQAVACETSDYSTAGFGIQMPADLSLSPGESVGLELKDSDGSVVFPATVMIQQDRRLGIKMDVMPVQLEKRLVQCTFGRIEAWKGWNDQLEPDRPLRSLAEVLVYGLKGYVHLMRRSQNVFSRRARPLPSAA